MQKVLIIEDNNEINQMLSDWLGKNDYEVKRAFSGTEGLLYFSMDEYSLVLLDLMLPGMSGEEVLSQIREKTDTPVIIISAKTDINDKVDLLENGADDYITKPFDLREVLARVKLQISKASASHKKSDNGIINFRELTIDTNNRTVKIAGHEVSLTRQEYNILHILLSNPDKIFTKEKLFEMAWDEYYVGADKTINVHISNIRNKLKEFTEDSYVETVWGIGYRAEI